MNKSDLSRNGYMLSGAFAKTGYDWWWHSFTAHHRKTGDAKVFFIEYFVCNPALGSDTAILGQLPVHKEKGVKPAYALIKVGTWGMDARQIHNFYPINAFSCPTDRLDLKIGACSLTEKHMKGFCKLETSEVIEHPEYMSDAGELSWDIHIDKKIAYHVGYGASKFFRALNIFEMFWHAQGIQTEYSGELTLDGETYDVIPGTSYGYADKNWGKDFTSPWLWLSSCHMKSLISGKTLKHSALELGGGGPKVLGISLGRKILGSLYYEGHAYEYNFSKFWLRTKTNFKFTEGETLNRWEISAQNRSSRIEVTIECPKNEMLLINYEAPNGTKRHNRLWNGGTGYGEIKLYHLKGTKMDLIDHIAVQSVGCEYGEYTE